MSQYRDEVLLNKIAAKIKKLRNEKGITLEQFYQETNVNISRIESAKANISVSTLAVVCKYLGVRMDEFLRGL